MEKHRDILESIGQLISTPKGEDETRPEYGSNLAQLIKQHKSNRLAIAATVNEAIANYEPRVRVIRTEIDLSAPDALTVIITLLIEGEQIQHAVSFPF